MNQSKSYTSCTKTSVVFFLILITVFIVSCNNQKSNEKTGEPASQNQLLPFSPMVEVNGTLYISGQIAPALNGESKSIEEETNEVMQKIGTILKDSGYDFNDVVRCSVFLADINDYAAVNKVYTSFFNGKYPSRNAVEVSRLVKGARIEISAIAVKQEIPGAENSKTKE